MKKVNQGDLVTVSPATNSPIFKVKRTSGVMVVLAMEYKPGEECEPHKVDISLLRKPTVEQKNYARRNHYYPFNS